MPTAIAVVGNPNVGKTTLFNVLTGLSLKTGNYPGVTVERKTGAFRFQDDAFQLVDLPGTYSLAAHSPDEMLVVDVLLNQQRGEMDVDVILVVLDASNLERNLYLVSQLCELDKPIVVALNMMDVAQKRGIRIDTKHLAELVSAPVVPVCATKRQGLDELKDALAEASRQRNRVPAAAVSFPSELMSEVDGLSADLSKHETELGRTVPQVEVFRILIDRNGYSEQRITNRLNGALARQLDERRTRATQGESLAAIESRSRYAWARDVTGACVTRPVHSGQTRSDRIDGLLTHRVYGTIFLLFLMSVMFQAIFSWALPLMDLIDAALGALGGFAGSVLPAGALQSLIVDGVIAGVGSVLIFLPQIIILSLFIAILEDCGYLSRAAYLMDRLLSRCGLSGHSFIPLLSSFACAIPGIMATRTIRSPRDRLATILVAPLMSCSARLPVYLVLIAAFVPHRPMLGGIVNLQGLSLLGMYCLGLIVAVPVSFLLKRTILRGKTPPFLLELPSYKWPQPVTIGLKVYEQGKEFVLRAGTIILAITVVVWALSYFPRSETVLSEYAQARDAAAANMPAGPERDAQLSKLNSEEKGALLRSSFMGRMGRTIEPVVEPLGWDWRIGVATIASFPAREVVVANLSTILNLSEEDAEAPESLDDTGASESVLIKTLRTATKADSDAPLFTLPVALSLMVFFALCAQCGATLAMMRRETGVWRWSIFAFGYMTVLAYVAALVIYQGTTALGLGA